MNIQVPHRGLLVYIFFVLFLCFTAEAASQSKRKAHSHSHRTQLRHNGVKGSGLGEVAHKNDDDQGDEDDDDDDDDDDDEDTPTKGTLHLMTKALSPRAAEEAQLKKAVDKADQALEANVDEQKDLNEKMKHYSDARASDREIDAQAKLVANETESAAMAGMLGKMWKEMRMFELPFFAQHVEEELHLLKREEKQLEIDLNAAQAKLSDSEKKIAESDEADKKKREEQEKAEEKKSKEEEEEKKGKEGEGDEEGQKEAKENEDDEDSEAVAKGQHQGMRNGVQNTEAAVTDSVYELQNEGAQAGVLRKYSFWHMNGKERTNLLWGTLVYFVFGILLAYGYLQVRKHHPEHLDAKPVQGARGMMPQKDFTNHLFGCFGDFHVCFWACCCISCRWADTVSQKNLLRYWKAFFLMFVMMVLHPYTAGISDIAIVVVGIIYRQKLRVKYGIEHGKTTVVTDCMAWSCCAPCAVIQEAREEAVKRDYSSEA